MWIISKESSRQVDTACVASIDVGMEGKCPTIDFTGLNNEVIMTITFEQIESRDTAYARIVEAIVGSKSSVTISDLK